jgi:hypothetical protein
MALSRADPAPMVTKQKNPSAPGAQRDFFYK